MFCSAWAWQHCSTCPFQACPASALLGQLFSCPTNEPLLSGNSCGGIGCDSPSATQTRGTLPPMDCSLSAAIVQRNQHILRDKAKEIVGSVEHQTWDAPMGTAKQVYAQALGHCTKEHMLCSCELLSMHHMYHRQSLWCHDYWDECAIQALLNFQVMTER